MNFTMLSPCSSSSGSISTANGCARLIFLVLVLIVFIENREASRNVPAADLQKASDPLERETAEYGPK